MADEAKVDAFHELRAGLFANRERQREAVEREDNLALVHLLEHEHRLLWLMFRSETATETGKDS